MSPVGLFFIERFFFEERESHDSNCRVVVLYYLKKEV